MDCFRHTETDGDSCDPRSCDGNQKSTQRPEGKKKTNTKHSQSINPVNLAAKCLHIYIYIGGSGQLVSHKLN